MDSQRSSDPIMLFCFNDNHYIKSNPNPNRAILLALSMTGKEA